MSSIMNAKAISLVTSGGIEERPKARTFRAKGSGGRTYVVTIDWTEEGRVTSCTCEAGHHERQCYHVKAAVLLIGREVDARQAASEQEYREQRQAEVDGDDE